MKKALLIIVCAFAVTYTSTAQIFSHGGCDIFDDGTYVLFKKETTFPDAAYPVFTELYADAYASLIADGIISIDMKTCGDLLFSAMRWQCDYDYSTPPSVPPDPTVRRIPLEDALMRVGYNGRFFHEDAKEWRAASDPTTRADAPISYGTRLGEIMYNADSWLKDQVFEYLLPAYERANDTPLVSEMYLVPEIDFNESTNRHSVYLTVDSTKIRIRTSEEDTVAVAFATEMRDDNATLLEEPEIIDMQIAFEAASWAAKAQECSPKRDGLPKTLTTTNGRTLRTHSTSVGVVRVQEKNEIHLIEGGVLVNPAMFQRDESTPPVSRQDVKLIHDVVDEIPSDMDYWTVSVGATTYSGVTIRL